MQSTSDNKSSQVEQENELTQKEEEEDEEGEVDMEASDANDDDLSSPDDEDNEDEEGEYGRPAFSVDSSQLTGEGVGGPQNGHDYLQLVQEERDKYPAVLSVRQPLLPSTTNSVTGESVTTSSTSVLQGEQQQLDPSNEPAKVEADRDNGQGGAHSEELDCVEEILVNFKELRRQIECMRTSLTLDEADLPVPISEQELKRQATSGESARRVNNLVKLMELGQPPQVSSLIDKNQLEIHMTLERLANESELMPNYSTGHNDWIYSLMACLREPIEPDICASLRRLARLCASSSDSSSTLIICIVRNYFGQTDLKYTGADLKRPQATRRDPPPDSSMRGQQKVAAAAGKTKATTTTTRA